jgi:hypothetical protein
MKRPPSQSEAFATGYNLATRELRDADPFTVARCRRVWVEQRDHAPDGPVRWGLDGMIHATANPPLRGKHA